MIECKRMRARIDESTCAEMKKTREECRGCDVGKTATVEKLCTNCGQGGADGRRKGLCFDCFIAKKETAKALAAPRTAGPEKAPTPAPAATAPAATSGVVRMMSFHTEDVGSVEARQSIDKAAALIEAVTQAGIKVCLDVVVSIWPKVS